MEKTSVSSFSKLFDKFSNKDTQATSSSSAFIPAFLVIIVWGITGPVFHFSDTWQLVINTVLLLLLSSWYSLSLSCSSAVLGLLGARET